MQIPRLTLPFDYELVTYIRLPTGAAFAAVRNVARDSFATYRVDDETGACCAGMYDLASFEAARRNVIARASAG